MPSVHVAFHINSCYCILPKVVWYEAYRMSLLRVFYTYDHLTWSSTIYADSIDKSSANPKNQALHYIEMIRAL